MTTTKRADNAIDLRDLLAEAEQVGPAHRIEYRDRIAALGRPAIEAIAPWLSVPTLAAFAIRVIERAGHAGEQAVATEILRGARRTIDPHVRPDLDWALHHLRTPVSEAVAPTLRTIRPHRVARAERPYGAGRAIGRTCRS